MIVRELLDKLNPLNSIIIQINGIKYTKASLINFFGASIIKEINIEAYNVELQSENIKYNLQTESDLLNILDFVSCEIEVPAASNFIQLKVNIIIEEWKETYEKEIY